MDLLKTSPSAKEDNGVLVLDLESNMNLCHRITQLHSIFRFNYNFVCLRPQQDVLILVHR